MVELKTAKPDLTIGALCDEAGNFSIREANHSEPSLFGITDGKAVGTYLEHKIQSYLAERYEFQKSSSAKGVDFPELLVDLKFTSIKQPQSSCPYRSARQKIYGLGYSLLVFVYSKVDDEISKTANLRILHTIFVSSERTADYQTTTGIQKILDNNGNQDDLIAFLQERMLPMSDVEAENVAEDLLKNPIKTGYLTISNALQWRLQYRRIIEFAEPFTEDIKRIV